MACDSAWSSGGMLMTKRSKIFRLPSGAIIGEAGNFDTRAVLELLAKVKKPSQLPTRKQLTDLQIVYGAILVLPSGRIFSVDIDEPESGQTHWSADVYEVSESYFACGSGKEHALTAMECGRSAKEAVHMAIRRDIHSRGPVHVLPLVPLDKQSKPIVSRGNKRPRTLARP